MNAGPDRRARPDVDAFPDPEPVREAVIPRLFLREPGWQVALKVGSERMFCYMTAPGEDHYHRINDGEIFLSRGDLRVCLPCADRHGLLLHEPKSLRPSVRGIDVDRPEGDADYAIRDDSERLL